MPGVTPQDAARVLISLPSASSRKRAANCSRGVGGGDFLAMMVVDSTLR